MTTLSRKQREIAAREQLFLDTARKIIRQEGYPALTMERVAELTEYSKGTVYKHFTCREDLFLALCAEGIVFVSNLFQNVYNLAVKSREKMTLLGLAYQAFSVHFPDDFDLLLATRNIDILNKASPERAAQTEMIDRAAHSAIIAMINQAVAEGDLQLNSNINPEEISFGAWSLCFGVLMLSSNPNIIRQFTLPDSTTVLLIQINALLDGYGWQPLSTHHDYSQIVKQANSFLSNQSQHRSPSE